MTRIVMSYRREDSEAMTGRINDRLVEDYGKASVSVTWRAFAPVRTIARTSRRPFAEQTSCSSSSGPTGWRLRPDASA